MSGAPACSEAFADGSYSIPLSDAGHWLIERACVAAGRVITVSEANDVVAAVMFSSQIADAIDSIVGGILVPGTTIPRSDLTPRFNVDDTPPL